MAADTLAHCLLFEHCDGLDRSAAVRLLEAFPDSASCLAAGPDAWRAAGLGGAPAKALAAACRDPIPRWLRVECERLQRLGVDAVTICDDAYPALLRMIHRPPPWLYLRGDRAALARPQVAVVGSRKASPLGLEAASRLAGELIAGGVAVTSGLALGIDGAAHAGALEAGGPTLAVMATGIDRIYPRRHGGLAARIVDNGCLLTELAPGAAPLRPHFPQRNRLISGLALGTVVVEAALPSGSLLTAAAAAEQGRDVFAVPWSPFHSGGRGCLQLLRDGAGLVQEGADILAAVGWCGITLPAASAAGPLAPRGLTSRARRVLAALEAGALPPDSLAGLLGEPVTAILGALGELEIAGVVRRQAGGYGRVR
jgi:DNA processing protein